MRREDQPAVERSPFGQLGCAEEYEVYVTSLDYETRVAGGRLGWSQIRWGRVLDDVSEATIEVPDRYGGVRCCAHLGGLVPWRYGIDIERDGEIVWSGPVTSIRRTRGNGGSITIGCHDVLARLMRRLSCRTQSEYREDDAGEILAGIINDTSHLASDPWDISCPVVVANVKLSRKMIPLEFEYAWDAVRDLLEAVCDMHVHAGTLHVWQPGTGWIVAGMDASSRSINDLIPGRYDANGELILGLFTETAYTELPTWSIDGFQQGNVAWVPAPDTGENGVRRFWTAEYDDGQLLDGVLDYVQQAAVYRGSGEGPVVNASGFQRQANATLALRAIAPAVVEGGTLSPSAPVTANQLHPGAIVEMDIYDDCFGQLLTRGRMKRCDTVVTAADSGLTESVSMTVQPPGFEDV